MKNFRKIIAAVLFALIVFSLTACSQDTLKEISKDLSVYTIEAVLSDENKTLEVKQTVDYCNNFEVELYDLYFHLYPNAYRENARFTPFYAGEEAEAYPLGKSYGGIQINTVKVNGSELTPEIGGQDEDILIVTFNKSLMPTERVCIEMTYTVNIPAVRHRFGYYNKTINLGNFYPIACMYENGEFDAHPYYANGDPFYSDIANYTVSITAPSKYTAAMSGDTHKTVSGENITWKAQTKAMRDFAVVLGEFEVKTAKAGNKTVNYYFYNDPESDRSLQAAADSVVTYTDMFGAYPYDTLAVVQTHFLVGGMEYPGLVYISDNSRITPEIYRDIILHETAHQWWYAAVGNDQVKYAWLDETITEYSATLFYEKNPQYNVEYSARIADALQSFALYCDLNSAGLDTSMDRRLPDYRSSLEYTFMAYTKGQVMLDTLRVMIGDKAFFGALKSYYNENYLKIAKPDNLIAAFEKASKRDLSGFFETWLTGKEITFGK